MKTQLFLILGTVLFSAGPADSRRRRYKECSEDRLKVRESEADVVLTGTVKRLYGVLTDLYGGEVLVKRVVKGDHIKAGETLIVEGFGNKDICTSQPIAKDSKIFLLNQLQTGRFRLNSSMIQINAPNLDKITATVKDLLSVTPAPVTAIEKHRYCVPYRRRPQILDEPCEKKYCKFNGDCFVENRRTVCRCPSICKDHYNPVCGSDGFTYNTECQMRVDSCRKKKQIYVRHEGLCLHSE